VIPFALRLIPVLLPVLGLICVGTGIWWIVQGSRSWSDMIALMAYTACGAAAAVFAPDDARLLDHLTRIPGLGRLTFATCAPIGVVLEGALALRLEGTWTRKDWRIVTLAIAPVAPLVALWPGARAAAGRDVAHLLYDGYYGHPAALLAWNVALGCVTTCACIVTVALGLRHSDATKDRSLVTVVGVFIAGAIFGLLIVLSAVTNDVFGTPVAPWQFATMTIFPLAILIVVSETLWLYAIYSLGQRLQHVRRLVKVADELGHVRDELVALLLVQSERLVVLCTLDGSRGPDAVARCCQANGVSLTWLQIALQAVRWITYRRTMICGRAYVDGAALTMDEVNGIIVGEAATQLRHPTYFDGEVCQVIICVLGPHHVPQWLGDLPPAQPWHHVLAGYINDPYAVQPLPRGAVVRRVVSWVRASGHLPGYLRTRVSLARMQGVVDLMQQDVEALALQCYERMAHLHNHIDAGLIDDMNRLCRAHGLIGDEGEVARETARWIGLFGREELRPARQEVVVAGGHGWTGSVAATMVAGVPPDGSRYAHTLRLLALSLTHVPREITPHRSPQRWHRAMLVLIERAMSPTTSADTMGVDELTEETASTGRALVGARVDDGRRPQRGG